MTIQFANKTQFNFDFPASGIDCATAANDVYTTPNEMRETIADLARLSFVRGYFKGKLELNQATGSGIARVKLSDGVNTLASADITLSGGQTQYFSVPADLGAVNGGNTLRVIVDIIENAAASTTATLQTRLDVEHPVVLAG